MKIEELTRRLELEEPRHFRREDVNFPVIDSHLYTVLGRRLFELYEKYKIEKDDQRDLESLIGLLTGFLIQRETQSSENKNSRGPLWKKWFRIQ